MKFLSLSSGGVCGALRQAEGLCVSQLVVIDSNGLRSSRSRGRWLDHRSLPCSEMRNLPLLQSLTLSLSTLSPSEPLLFFPQKTSMSQDCSSSKPLSHSLQGFLLCPQTQRQKRQEMNALLTDHERMEEKNNEVKETVSSAELVQISKWNTFDSFGVLICKNDGKYKGQDTSGGFEGLCWLKVSSDDTSTLQMSFKSRVDLKRQSALNYHRWS